MAHRDPKLTLADLPLAHVVRCSPCYQEYIRFRQMAVFARGLKIAAASVIAATILVAGVLLLRNLAINRAEPSLSQQQQAAPHVPAEQPSSVPSPRPSSRIKIDLAAFSPPRGVDAGSAAKAIHLPRHNLRITLQMPLGFDPGAYVVQLKASKGALYCDQRALGYVADQTTYVDIECDLTATPPGKATLTIRPPGLSWRGFPVIIE
jgi:hypothetical protein